MSSKSSANKINLSDISLLAYHFRPVKVVGNLYCEGTTLLKRSLSNIIHFLCEPFEEKSRFHIFKVGYVLSIISVVIAYLRLSDK